MRDVPGLKYQVVAEYGAWPTRRERVGPVVYRWADAVRICATLAQQAGRPNKLIVLYAEDETDIDEMFDQLTRGGRPESFITPDEADIERQKLEDGPGSDHDIPYTFEAPTWTPEELKWARLLARVQAGELGGENDGNEDSGDQAGEDKREADE